MLNIRIGDRIHQIDRLPEKCPYCHKAIVPLIQGGSQRTGHIIDAFLTCPSDACSRAFIGFYGSWSGKYSWQGETSFGLTEPIAFDDVIMKLSPNFIAIFNEANYAEKLGLAQICGVGYRKALEFLIKDYAISNMPTETENIKSKFLGVCINDYIDNDKIKNAAVRAAWLGNDETHYTRIWETHDLRDLKALIKAIVSWIDIEEYSKSINISMPDKRKT